jgi:hypothetical protein
MSVISTEKFSKDESQQVSSSVYFLLLLISSFEAGYLVLKGTVCKLIKCLIN